MVVLAYVLGATRLADSYNLANNTPNMIFDLVLGGVLSATLVPVFVERLITREDDEGSRAVSAVLTLAAAVLTVASVATVAGAPWIVRLYNSLNHTGAARNEQAVATVFLALFAPQVAFYGFAALAEAVLNARRRFAAPKFAPVLNNVVTMAVLLLARAEVKGLSLHDARHRTGLLVLLGLGTTAGVAVLNKTTEAYVGKGAVVDALALGPGIDAADGEVAVKFRPNTGAAGEIDVPRITLLRQRVLLTGRQRRKSDLDPRQGHPAEHRGGVMAEPLVPRPRVGEADSRQRRRSGVHPLGGSVSGDCGTFFIHQRISRRIDPILCQESF